MPTGLAVKTSREHDAQEGHLLTKNTEGSFNFSLIAESMALTAAKYRIFVIIHLLPREHNPHRNRSIVSRLCLEQRLTHGKCSVSTLREGPVPSTFLKLDNPRHLTVQKREILRGETFPLVNQIVGERKAPQIQLGLPTSYNNSGSTRAVY